MLLNLRAPLPTLNTLDRRSLSRDARLILNKCQYLHRTLQRPPTCPELEDYAHHIYAMLVENFSEDIVQNLSYDARLKLALIAWHFDTEGLHKSLRSPINKTAWATIYANYQAHSPRQILYDDFRQSFDFLLLSQQPTSQQPRRHPYREPGKHHVLIRRQALRKGILRRRILQRRMLREHSLQ